MEKENKKIFVVGPARSGTTLLRKLISSHSRVVGVNETEILKRVNPDRQTHQEMIEMIARSPKEEEIVKNYFEKNIPVDKKLSSTDFLDFYCEAQRQHFNKEAYVEKSPVHSLFLEEILSAIDGSKILAILRDPRAALASRLYTPRISRGKHLGLPKFIQFFLNLSELIFIYRVFEKKYKKGIFSDRLLFLSYEDLVQTPAETMDKIFSFSGLPFESVHENIDPLDLREAARNRLDQMNSSFGVKKTKVVSTRSLKNWEGKMSKWQIKLIEDAVSRANFSLVNKFFPDLHKNILCLPYSWLVILFSYLDYHLFMLKNVKLKYKFY